MLPWDYTRVRDYQCAGPASCAFTIEASSGTLFDGTVCPFCGSYAYGTVTELAKGRIIETVQLDGETFYLLGDHQHRIVCVERIR